MNLDFRLYPAVRLLCLIAFGSIILYLFGLKISIIIFLLIAILLFVVTKDYKTTIYYLFALFLSIFFYQRIENADNNFPKKIIQDQPALIKGKIIKEIKSTNKYSKVILDGVIDAKYLPPINDKIMLTIFHYNKDLFKLERNNRIFLKSYINIPKSQILENSFDERKYLASLGVHWTGKCNIRAISIIGQVNIPFEKFINNLSESIDTKIDLLFPNYANQIVKATIIGDKSKLSYELKQVFSLSGTAHLLAISGLHIGIIAAIIYVLLGFIRNDWLKFIIFSMLILTFIFVTGNSPSALRAGIMAIIVLLVKTTQRHVNLLNILSLATLIILLITPELYYSIGFRLSFAAVAGIALMMLPLKNLFDKILISDSTIINYIKISLAVSLSATIGTMPIVAYYFGIFVPLSPIINLFVIPLMSSSMVFSVISIILSYIYFPLAQIYAYASQFCIDLSIIINKFFINLPYCNFKNSEIFIPSFISAVLFLYLVLSNNIKKFRFRFIISIIIFVLATNLELKPSNTSKIVYPSEQFVAIELSKQKSMLIFDRMPAQRPSMDFTFFVFLSNQLKANKIKKIYYSGNSGLYYVDRLKTNYKFDSYEMDINTQKLILNTLNLKNLIQKIDYE